MSKRIVLILSICVIALSCVYAGSSDKGVIDVSLSTSSYQMIVVDKDIYRATSGLAASVGYMNNVWKGLSVGAALEWSNYKQEKLVPYGSFNNIAVLARCSYKIGLSEKVFADAGLGLGYEFSIVGKDNTFHSFVAELNGGFGIIIDDVFSLLAGAKAKAVIQKTTHIYSVLPYIGAGISL